MRKLITMGLYRNYLKRVFDIVAAISLGIATMPISVITAVLIKVTSPGPVFYKQARLTTDEKEFEIIKFRSMYTVAPSLPPYELKNAEAFITPVGKWIRKLSIDELPQLINVLRGEMSFVGPRPGAAKNEEKLREARRDLGIFKVRPGITGWAQVNGRDELAKDPYKKAKFDARYVNSISFLKDLKILLLTVGTVFKGKGYVEGDQHVENPRKPIKVLFLIHTLGGGGAERVLTDLVNNLSPEVFDITVMTVVDTGIYREKLSNSVMYKSIFRVPRAWKGLSNDESGTLNAEAGVLSKFVARVYALSWSIAPAKLVRKLFIREKFDVEVAFLEGIPAKVISAAPEDTVGKLSWVHTDFSTNHRSKQFFVSNRQELSCYRRFDKVIFLSRTAKDAFQNVVGSIRQPIVLSNYVDLDGVSKADEAPYTKSEKFRICTVGRLTPVKGIDRLLDVKEKLESLGIDFELIVAGDGVEMERLKRQASELHDVQFLGYQRDPFPYIKSADLFLIPSYVEGLSTVMLEALALNVPVMSTRVSGSELLSNIQVLDNDADAIQRGLRAVITNKEFYSEIRKQSSEVSEIIMRQNREVLKQVEDLLKRSVK